MVLNRLQIIYHVNLLPQLYFIVLNFYLKNLNFREFFINYIYYLLAEQVKYISSESVNLLGDLEKVFKI